MFIFLRWAVTSTSKHTGDGASTGLIDIRAYDSVYDADPIGNTDDFAYGGDRDIRADSIKIADGSIGTLNNVLEIDSTTATAVVLSSGLGGGIEDSGDLNIGEITGDGGQRCITVRPKQHL